MIKCEICGRELKNKVALSSHIVGSHKITSKEYYDLFLGTDSKPTCKMCGKPTSYINITKGYHTYCSIECKNMDKELQSKITDTQRKLYGGRGTGSKSIKEKAQSTMLQKTGYKNNLENPKCREKIYQHLMNTYGGLGWSSTSIKDKALSTMNEVYGGVGWGAHDVSLKIVETRHNNNSYKSFCRTQYLFDGIIFDSSYEIYYYIYCKNNNIPIERNLIGIDYFVGDVRHQYFPDFIINDELIEIKGPQFLDDDGNLVNPFVKNLLDESEKYKLIEKDIAKNECMKKHNVTLISDISMYKNYVENTFGKDYINSFKIHVQEDKQ